MQVALTGHDAEAGTIDWIDPETGEKFTTPVTGGHCKLQWKPDWAMRWYALGVDYEMAGKDLIDSVKVSSAIVRVLGGGRQKVLITNSFLMKKARRFQNRKAMVLRSKSG